MNESEFALPHIAALKGSIICSKDSKQRLYMISLRLHALFCLKALCMEVRLKRKYFFSLDLLSSRIVSSNVVPEDSKIMLACQSGDSSIVLDLLSQRRASVNDITPDNLSPLSVSPSKIWTLVSIPLIWLVCYTGRFIESLVNFTQ